MGEIGMQGIYTAPYCSLMLRDGILRFGVIYYPRARTASAAMFGHHTQSEMTEHDNETCPPTQAFSGANT
jgi:hypothetical protein